MTASTPCRPPVPSSMTGAPPPPPQITRVPACTSSRIQSLLDDPLRLGGGDDPSPVRPVLRGRPAVLLAQLPGAGVGVAGSDVALQRERIRAEAISPALGADPQPLGLAMTPGRRPARDGRRPSTGSPRHGIRTGRDRQGALHRSSGAVGNALETWSPNPSRSAPASGPSAFASPTSPSHSRPPPTRPTRPPPRPPSPPPRSGRRVLTPARMTTPTGHGVRSPGPSGLLSWTAVGDRARVDAVTILLAALARDRLGEYQGPGRVPARADWRTRLRDRCWRIAAQMQGLISARPRGWATPG
jgi:hypothetical protein